MSAPFPANIWNGQSGSRTNASTIRRPDAADWERLITELAAVQSLLKTNFQTSSNAAAIVQSDSTTQGWLPPRMTTTQMNAIVSPPEGLVVYSTTDHTLHVFNGTAWKAVTIA